MALKTNVGFEPGKQFITITRDFDLPVDLLFRAHVEAELIEQWMENTVVKLEARQHGSFRYEKRDDKGNVVFGAHGTIHEITPNERIVRTFEMDNAGLDVQIEFIEFKKLIDDTSRLNTLAIYKTGHLRDEHMKWPFAKGLNWGHNRLQEIMSKLK